MDQRTLSEANEEALILWELFGARAYGAVQRRVALAIDRELIDDSLFWLEVQSRLYGYAGDPFDDALAARTVILLDARNKKRRNALRRS